MIVLIFFISVVKQFLGVKCMLNQHKLEMGGLEINKIKRVIFTHLILRVPVARHRFISESIYVSPFTETTESMGVLQQSHFKI